MKKNLFSRIKFGGFSLRLLSLILCAVISTAVFYPPEAEGSILAENAELRGVWVSTVFNLDYPSSATTDAAVLRTDLDKILDNCEKMGFNAIFFQVRPCGDAFYKSEIFPWSKYLTGKQGLAPSDGFDPLLYATTEAHKRGIELHAWINPYRITASAKDTLSQNNPAVLTPNLVLTDADGKMYYNPGDSASVELIVNGACEIVENYDVDGIHLDDYFYPSASFNDEVTYSYFKDDYKSIEDWRRANVDKLVKTLDEKLHEIDKDISFGISPRGIWANKTDLAEGSDTAGNGSYNTIYADSRGWVKNGWVDYIMPQLYWNIGYEIADYSILCDWWSDVVRGTDTKLYIGEGAYRTTTETTPAWSGENGLSELRTHILNGRASDSISGFCCFTYNDFLENPSIFALMQELNHNSSAENSVPVYDSMSTADGDSVPTIGGKYVNKFTDMNEYWWAMDAVNALAERGIIKGRSETEFDPDTYITRADNTVLLLRILGKTAEFDGNFADVAENSYYYNEIGMARALGIASGVGNNRFDPTSPVRRQDMATLAYRVMSKEGVLTSIPNTAVLNQFTDADYIDFYAREAIAACIDSGLMSGYGDGTINPQGYASRIEVALFMYRISELIK